MDPIVPGMNRKRYEYRSSAWLRYFARKVAIATLERLSLQSEGWQAWHEIRTSAEFSPGR
jgi:hypothetical protein